MPSVHSVKITECGYQPTPVSKRVVNARPTHQRGRARSVKENCVNDFYQRASCWVLTWKNRWWYLETMDLDGLGIELQAVLINEELLNIFTLITLELDHLSHFRIDDNGAITSEFLLDDL